MPVADQAKPHVIDPDMRAVVEADAIPSFNETGVHVPDFQIADDDIVSTIEIEAGATDFRISATDKRLVRLHTDIGFVTGTCNSRIAGTAEFSAGLSAYRNPIEGLAWIRISAVDRTCGLWTHLGSAVYRHVVRNLHYLWIGAGECFLQISTVVHTPRRSLAST